MNKKGADKFLSVYWFLILFLVAGAVIYMASLFYGSPFDVRDIEGNIMADQIANCITSQGYLDDKIFSSDFQNNFPADCGINFSTEDFSDWQSNGQYYAELSAYKFNQNPEQQFYGESGSYASSNLGEQLMSVHSGNPNLKTSWELVKPSSGFLGLNLNKRNVNTIVIHATAGNDVEGALQTIAINQLSIHYIIDRDGTIYSSNNNPTSYKSALVPESDIAQHAGCYDPASKTQWAACSTVPSCLDSNNLIGNSCQKLNNPQQGCCIEENAKSIGIELVNLQSSCTGSSSLYCKNAITIDGKQWESYSSAQINSLINLVSDISSRYNIPLDRSHIIGHYQSSSYKTDPGPEFPWDNVMQALNSRGAVSISSSEASTGNQQRSFYALDKGGSQYIVQILTLVGKKEKNE